MQKPIAVFSTDWHIKLDNTEQSIDLAAQKIQLAKKLGVETLICGGDIFEARKAQPEYVFHAFTEILDMIHEAGMKLCCVPGNHDKTDYSSWKSYLDQYEHHPALKLFKTPTDYTIEGKRFLFMPFIEEELWVKSLEEVGKIHNLKKEFPEMILISHQAVTGSRNNDGSIVESKITAGLLKQFNKVLLGHYHNAQQPCSNVWHLPSWKQDNFGEDAEKGFTVINDDFTTEFVKSDFKEYVILELDAGKVDAEMLGNLISEADKGDVYLRTDLVGNQSDIKSIDTNKLKAHGIKIKTVSTEIVESVTAVESGETVDFESDEKVQTLFKEFCLEKGFDHEEGLEYLNLILR